ncbi:uncharacterized protein [Rutidosis leptorrhynchoides]|uniref:uncharacterized protein n=1 Tax=Rutidosis leptorrhynchoides TaxID=125765 RepID=UPI003A99E7F1
MEDSVKEQSSVSGNKGGKSAKLLRYPLRSSSKPKDDKLPASSPSIVSASRRGKATSSVSQSVSVLNISAAKEKLSAKPPRRMSIPNKLTASPAANSTGYNTPISEARVANRAANVKGKTDIPNSEVSRSLTRKKFTVLSSASYWLSHIKLAEASGKHQLSLGFFKLALEAGCENVQLLKEELKLYACRHNLVDLGEYAKEVFQGYEITETIEQLQVSETCSHVPEDGDDTNSLSSATGGSKLKPRSLNSSGATSTAKESVKETTHKSNFVSRIKAPVNKKTNNQNTASDTKRINKQDFKKEKLKVETEGMKPANDAQVVDTDAKDTVVEENKENMDAPLVEEISLEA